MAEPTCHPTQGTIAGNALWNVSSVIVPMLVAFIAIPVIVRQLGADRFGLLTLSWLVIGYFSLFDFGLGRALTQSVASRIGTDRERDIPVVFWTTLTIMAVLGTIGCVLGSALAVLAGPDWLNVPDRLRNEATWSMLILAISLPMIVTSTGLRGTLEAYHLFRPLSTLRTALGIFNFVGPLVMLPFTSSVVAIVAVLAVGRTISCVVLWWLCASRVPHLVEERRIAFDFLRPLLKTGGWMSVSNIVSPILDSVDRFLVASWVSIAAVTYYATPFDALMRLLIVPEAISAVMFPSFAAGTEAGGRQASRLFERSTLITFVLMFPISLFAITFAREGLHLWLGAEFANRSTHLLQILALGLLTNSLAQVPFVLIQGRGRPDVTAKLHLIELPVYIAVLALFVNAFGVIGAGIAWSLRVTLDFALLTFTARRVLGSPAPTARVVIRRSLPIVAILAMLPLAAIDMAVVFKTIFLLVAGAIFVAIAWKSILEPGERQMLRRLASTPRLRQIAGKA